MLSKVLNDNASVEYLNVCKYIICITGEEEEQQFNRQAYQYLFIYTGYNLSREVNAFPVCLCVCVLNITHVEWQL